MRTINCLTTGNVARILIGCLAVLALSNPERAWADTWTQKADMPTARFAVSTCVVEGKIYAIGAFQGSHLLTRVEAYDPATDTWTKKASMPTPRTFISISVMDEKIYVVGGESYWHGPILATVEAYDPVTDTWMRKADLPVPRSGLTTSVVNGKLYAIGGSISENLPEVSTVEMYDPTMDTWTRKADMPTGRVFPSAIVLNGLVYVIGGAAEDLPTKAFTNVEVYDPATDTWTKRANMPVPRIMGMCKLNGKFYGFGGTNDKYGMPLSTVLQYDPAIDFWTVDRKGGLPGRLYGMGVSTVGGRIYLIGGTFAGFPYDPYLSTVWEYIPSPDFDFNGDGIVDAQDMSMMVDHWHTDASRYDLAPTPGGDGIVDVEDLIALSEHLFDDDRTVAHWRMDELEGDVAYDSARQNDALLEGGPLWIPDGGQIGGALSFDGEDDYANTLFALNPSESTFSVFAWIKGGAPGQVIVSQSQGMNWLALGMESGFLKTELTNEIRKKLGPPLDSTELVHDGDWHHIGLVWDGTHRILYVDDIEVARGESMGIASSEGNLIIGAGAGLEDGSFFSGLIDDIRIYDRAVTP